MSFLLDLIPKIKKLHYALEHYNKRIYSWVFFNLKSGYVCSRCGRKHLKFAHSECDAKIGNTRMLLSWGSSIGKFGEVICPECAVQEIHNAFAYYKRARDPYEISVGKCDFTGINNVLVVPTINTSTFHLRFGREWWNGFHATEEALILGITNCNMSSSHQTYYNGKLWYNSGKYLVSKPQTYTEFMKAN